MIVSKCMKSGKDIAEIFAKSFVHLDQNDILQRVIELIFNLKIHR